MGSQVWPFIGGLGKLVEVPFSTSESESRAARVVESVTVAGVRRAQVLPRSPRSWSVDMSHASPVEYAALEGFASGAWGGGPWHWVSVSAQLGNLLTPREAMLQDFVPATGLVAAGPVRGADGGWVPRSLTNGNSATWTMTFRSIPVVAGRSVTFSADVQGSAGLALAYDFRDAAGVQVLGGYGGSVGAAMARTSVTVTPPATAISVRVGIRKEVAVMARPQVTWTDDPVEYSPGYGCRSAVVDGVSSELLTAGRNGMYSQVGFTVLEVGSAGG